MSERARGQGPEPDREASAPSGRAPESAAAGPAPEPADVGPPGPQEPGPAVAARIAELEDQRLRALADLENVRKKCASQVSAARAETQVQVAAHWLPVVDNLERALAHSQADPRSIIEGISAVRDQAVSVLTQLGFPRRDDLGETFDPVRHEAVASRDASGARDGSVVEVVRPAYGEGDRQLRPAQVIVAKAD